MQVVKSIRQQIMIFGNFRQLSYFKKLNILFSNKLYQEQRAESRKPGLVIKVILGMD